LKGVFVVVMVKVPEFVLTEVERDRLVGWSRESSRLGMRARIVLGCAELGVVYARLARELGVSGMTVTKVRRRFAAERVDGGGVVWGGRGPTWC
jgi:Homeodomain-like domain